MDKLYLELNAVNDWTAEWPEEEGYFWFFGWCWGVDGEPEMHFVENRKISNGFTRITNGYFMWKREGAIGLWTKADFQCHQCMN